MSPGPGFGPDRVGTGLPDPEALSLEHSWTAEAIGTAAESTVVRVAPEAHYSVCTFSAPGLNLSSRNLSCGFSEAVFGISSTTCR